MLRRILSQIRGNKFTLSRYRNAFKKISLHSFYSIPGKRIMLLTLLSLAGIFTLAAHVNTAQAPYDIAYLTDNSLLNNNGDGTLENKQREAIVVVDPGHGGEDWGTHFGDMYEKNVNLDISDRLGKLLEQEGIKVIYTRKTDVFVELKERAEIANYADAALFISVHNNKMPNNPGYKGTETLYCPDENLESQKINGKKFAKIVQAELVKALNTINNGIIDRPNLAVLRRTNMPAVIAEIAYISNASDRAKLATSEFRQKAATALYNSVLKAFDEMGIFKQSDGSWMTASK